MPPVSEAQRRAMRAAAGGHSTLGIPKSVGEEFDAADQGGKLPKRAKGKGKKKLALKKKAKRPAPPPRRPNMAASADEYDGVGDGGY